MTDTQPAVVPGLQDQQRSRLIDHFKRAYQIIVGLAITQACSKLFPDGHFTLADPAFWMFCTFFITVVPIFHGGDRSLDIKYLGSPQTRLGGQIAYVWDVYMLLVTATFFVKISQTIPGQGLIGSVEMDPKLFYAWMAAMLLFDALVLLVDWVKSSLLNLTAWKDLEVYGRWIALNVVFGAACYYLAYKTSLSSEHLGMAVFAGAALRTVLDYLFGRKFMFP